MYYPMYFDPTYMLVLIGVVICLAASAKIFQDTQSFRDDRKRSGGAGASPGGHL